jgi:hypothetical protein
LAQRSYPDRVSGFLPCFFLLSNDWNWFMLLSRFMLHSKQKTRLSGRVCIVNLEKAKKPGL